MTTPIPDLRYAALAVLTLSLGVGAATAAFWMVDDGLRFVAPFWSEVASIPLGIAAIAFLLACTSVASTLLAASDARRQPAAEGVWLATLATVGGVPVATILLRRLSELPLADFLPGASHIALGARAIAFGCSVALLAASVASVVGSRGQSR
jgi:hypothetical protein